VPDFLFALALRVIHALILFEALTSLDTIFSFSISCSTKTSLIRLQA
jgi:hypothetical protein